MDTIGHMQCGNQTQTKNQKPPKPSDTQVPRPDLRIAIEKTAKQTAKGARPNNNTHTNRLPQDTVVFTTVSIKTCTKQINYRSNDVRHAILVPADSHRL
jgi:hypothetical protein